MGPVLMISSSWTILTIRTIRARPRCGSETEDPPAPDLRPRCAGLRPKAAASDRLSGITSSEPNGGDKKLGVGPPGPSGQPEAPRGSKNGPAKCRVKAHWVEAPKARRRGLLGMPRLLPSDAPLKSLSKSEVKVVEKVVRPCESKKFV